LAMEHRIILKGPKSDLCDQMFFTFLKN